MHWLVCPNGKKNGHRGVDFVQERMNLKIKVSRCPHRRSEVKLTGRAQRKHGGKGSNHTEKMIIKESILVDVYDNHQKNFLSLLSITPSTGKHQGPDMVLTFEKLAAYMKKCGTHQYNTQRSPETVLVNPVDKGLELVLQAELAFEADVDMEDAVAGLSLSQGVDPHEAVDEEDAGEGSQEDADRRDVDVDRGPESDEEREDEEEELDVEEEDLYEDDE
jgi:hypothetical protein